MRRDSGISQEKLFQDITDEDWNSVINTNLYSVFCVTQEAVKSMINNKSGLILNISSIYSVSGGSLACAYSASKAGIDGITKSLAKELGPSGIRVNCVAPGVIKTDMLKNFTDDDLKELADETPLMRLGRPEDVANAVIFLASDKASFITGQTLSVDGGFVI